MEIKKIGKALLFSVVSLFVLTILIFFTETFLLLRYSKEFAFVVLNNKTDRFEATYSKWNNHSKIFLKILKPVVAKIPDYWETVANDLPEILGRNDQKVYFVLLQNNTELRPTGGFLGSYAKLIFENGGLKDVIVQDIYVPDGQLKGHVDPPAPIQKAFGQGWFKLRDANWEPDFPASAKTVAWFFDKGNEEKADGIIAINLELIKDLLKVVGPTYLSDYKLSIDEQSFYQTIQSNSEVNFFPGSTQKASILSDLSFEMLNKIRQSDLKRNLKILKIIYKNLEEKQILLFFNDEILEEICQKLNWGGSIIKNVSKDDEINDYLFLVEANLGANKANQFIERKVEQSVFIERERIKKNIKINFTNFSKYETPVKPIFWGGNYLNFLRLYVPKEAENFLIKDQGKEVLASNLYFEEKKDKNLKAVGFFITVPALSERLVEISYEIPLFFLVQPEKILYKLIIQKQSGIKSVPYKLNLIKNNEVIFSKTENIIKDQEFETEILYN